MTGTTHVRRRHQRRVSTGVDAALFFLVFIGGAATIFWLKEAGFDQIRVTAVPCILLLLYASIVKFVPHFRLRDDQAGDNCYYLGFLFTLISLAHALAAFARAGGAEEIVEDFGIALASTIIGLALRVAFIQMRQDPVEIESEARLELVVAAQRLRSELDQSALEINAFRRSTQQSIADGMEELNVKVGKLLEKSLARYDEITSGSAERIDRTLVAFSENAQRLNEMAEQTVTSVEALRERIDAIRAPEDLIETKFVSAAEAVADIVTEIKHRAREELKAFQELRELINGATTATAGLEGRVANVAEVLDGLKELNGTLETAERRIGALTAGFSSAGKAIVTTIDELHRTLVEPAHEVSTALSSIVHHAETLREIEIQLSKLAPAIEEQIELIKRLREEGALPRPSRGFFGFR